MAVVGNVSTCESKPLRAWSYLLMQNDLGGDGQFALLILAADDIFEKVGKGKQK